MYISLTPLLTVLITFLIAVLITAWIILRHRRAARTQAITEPTCGQCGYCVRGIVGLTCPECGADLREVGIVPPGANRSAKPGNPKLIWTLTLPVLALAISWLLVMTILPYTQTQKISRMIYCQAPFLNMTLQAISSQRLPQPVLMGHSPAPPEQMWLLCTATGQEMDINLKTGAYTTYNPNSPTVAKSSGFNGAAIANMLKSPAVNATDPRVLNLCQSIYGTLTEIPQVVNTGKFTTMYDPTGKQIGIAHPAFAFIVHDEPSPFVIGGLALFWILVWLYGLRIIHRRSRTRAPMV